jgi:hypothetical protein
MFRLGADLKVYLHREPIERAASRQPIADRCGSADGDEEVPGEPGDSHRDHWELTAWCIRSPRTAPIVLEKVAVK